MFVKQRFLGVCMALWASVIMAQEAGTPPIGMDQTPPQTDKISATDAINLNLISPFFGNINLSYEHLLKEKHGVMLQGGYFFSSGFSAALHYRFHYFSNESHSKLNSPFFGAFLYFQKSKGDIDETENGVSTVFHVDRTFFVAGLNWGRRMIWPTGLTIVYRIGYGYPFSADYKWEPYRSGDAKSAENTRKIIAGIDCELSLGYAF